MASHVYHWKHGWVPLDHTAALSKAKGNHDQATAMLRDAGSHDAGMHSRSDVAKALVGLPSISNPNDRHAAMGQVTAAAQTHGATDLLPGRAARAKNPMNQMTNGTQYRETPAGIIAVRGNREIHLLGTSVNAQKKARQMLAAQSFDKLFKAGKSAPGMKNTSFHRLH